MENLTTDLWPLLSLMPALIISLTWNIRKRLPDWVAFIIPYAVAIALMIGLYFVFNWVSIWIYIVNAVIIAYSAVASYDQSKKLTKDKVVKLPIKDEVNIWKPKSKALEYVDTYLGTRIDTDWVRWYQCVDQAKHFAKFVHGVTLSSFWWGAINWWRNEANTFWSDRIRTENVYGDETNVPKSWDIIFFWWWPFSQYWHVAWVVSSNGATVKVVEQNGGKGKWEWTGSDAIRVHEYSFENVLGRYSKI